MHHIHTSFSLSLSLSLLILGRLVGLAKLTASSYMPTI